MQSQNHAARNFAWISPEFWSLDAVQSLGNDAVGVFARAASWCAAHSPVHRFIPRDVAAGLTEQLATDAAALERSGLFVAAPDGWTLGLEQHVRLQAREPGANGAKERRFDALSFGARGLLMQLLVVGRRVAFAGSDHGAELAAVLCATGADHHALADALRELVHRGFATLRGQVLSVERAPVPRSVRRALRIRAAMYGAGAGDAP